MSYKKHSPEEARLLTERENILRQLRHLGEVIKSEVDLELDEADEQITEHETAAILVGILERRLVDIDAALKAIHAGQYSVCERCGERIEPERLVAKPDARYCVSCQSIIERILHRTQAELMPERQDAFANWVEW
jgi:DnaK suppressor protein